MLIGTPKDGRTTCTQGLPELIAALANVANSAVRLVAFLLPLQLIWLRLVLVRNLETVRPSSMINEC